MAKANDKHNRRQVRHLRVRKKISGTPERPRLAVFKSNQHTYAQLIDDTQGVTLGAASTLSKELADLSHGANVEAARRVGAAIAKVAQERDITQVVFDRGGFIYHGRIKALAEAAREAGLKF